MAADLALPGVDELVARHRLAPHPEGGWFRRVVESPHRVETLAGPRPAMTSILYLLDPTRCSRPHRVRNDETWHFLDGDPLLLAEVVGGVYREIVLGDECRSTLVHRVPGGAWQAARCLGRWSLLGCTVAPGFDYADFEIAYGARLDALLETAPAMAQFA